MLQNGGQLVAHVRGHRDVLPFTLRFQLAQGSLQRIEVTVGRPPKDPAPITVSRRGEEVPGRRTGSRVKLDVPAFDTHFALQDSTGLASEALADPSVQRELERLVHGSVHLFPGEAVHCVCRPGAGGWPLPLAEIAFSAEDASLEELVALLDLMVTLASRVGVRG